MAAPDRGRSGPPGRATRRRGGRTPHGERQTAGPGRSLVPHSWVSWIALGSLAVYALYWASQVFRYHPIGNYGVETDFYWKYGPAARDLLRGAIDIANYDSKGWGYPAAVALLARMGLDVFRAGQVIALLSAVAAGWLAYRLHRSLLGPGVALASLGLLLVNPTFVVNTYEVGTDMFFFAVILASMALLLRSRAPKAWAIAVSGLLGGWAFSTRYNGLFLMAGAVLYLLVLEAPKGPWGPRLKRAGLWVAGFVLAALPWLWINAAHTGNPLTNSNYINVGYEVYGKGNWEQFMYGGDRKIHSMVDVVRLDPMLFVGAMLKNIVVHLKQDLTQLMPLLWGIWALIGGLLLLTKERPDRRTGAYAAFWGLYFLTLVPVFYGTRFSLPLAAFYGLLAAWPFVSPFNGRAIQGLERSFPLRTFLFLALWVGTLFHTYQAVGNPSNPEGVRAGPHEILDAVDYLKVHGSGEALLARKPHAAFLAGMRFAPIPAVDSPAALHDVAVKERARYLLISAAELSMRAALRPFATGEEIPGFKRVFESQGALVYEVVPQTPGSSQ
jgi:hypothetical protein